MKQGSQRPHVLMTADAVGGVWVFATTLAKELCGRGYRVTLVTLGPPPNGDQLSSLRNIPRFDLRITDLALEWMDPEGHDVSKAHRTLLAIDRSISPDLVHLNSYREACFVWSAPVLVGAHSCVRSWWRACRDEEPNEPRWHQYATNVALGLLAADAWVAPTTAFRDVVSKLYAPPLRGGVIANGADAMPSRRPKQACIMAAGRLWDEAKNLSLLTSMAGDLPWPIRVAGSLRSHDGTIRQTEGVEWLGNLPRQELLSHLRDAGIFVSPARYEPFGLTVLEAASAGCALVLSDLLTFRELWDGAALFIDPTEETTLRAALDLLCRDQRLRSRLQAAAARRARQYSLHATAGAYAAVYGALVSGAQGFEPERTMLSDGLRA